MTIRDREQRSTLKIVLPDRLAALNRGAVEQGDIITAGPMCVFVHPDAVRDVMVTHDGKFCKSRALRWARWTLGKGLLTSDGELHKRQRPVIQPTMHPKRLGGYAQTMARHAGLAADSWTDGQSIDAHREMTVLTLHIVAETLFGQALGPEVDAISVAMSFNVRAFQRMTTRLGRILAFFPTPFSIRYLLSRHKVLGVLRRFVSDRRASGEVKDDLLGRLLAARTPDGRPAMSEQQLIDECVTLFAAGHETTANALTFTLMLVAHHAGVQTKLNTELDAFLTDPTRPLTIEDVDRLPYTRQVIAEAMRLYPPAWVQGREATQDVSINGTEVKKGRTIFISQWVTHRDPRWWSNPDAFDPDRFDANRLAASVDGSPRPRWSYYPFGGGSRSCVGEAFAWAEMVIVLATLTRRWRFEPDPSAAAVRLEAGITLRPANAVKLIVHRRA